MKRKLLMLCASVLVSLGAFAQTQLVTFQVENPNYTAVYVAGSWNNWSNWPGTAMTLVAPGKYSATIAMNSSATYEFLFVNDSSGTAQKEILDPTWPCTNANTQYTNRIFTLGTADTGLCYTFATCTTCTVTPPPPPPAPVNVTFQVEMPDSTPVHMIGSWDWSAFPGIQLTQVAPNKYTATKALMPNQTYEFKFLNGVGNTFEVLDPTWPCTNGNTVYTNRVIAVAGVDTGICNTFSSCTTCTVAPPPVDANVTFAVQNTDSTPVYVFGSWSGWGNWPGNAMTLNTTTGNWEATIPLPKNVTYEYLFVNGTSTKEVMDPTWPCTNGNSQFTNRVLALGSNDSTICQQWESCNACTVAPPPTYVNVKFAVQSTDSTPVYVFGNWNNWSNFPGAQMTYNASTSSYEATVSILENSAIEYLYVNGVGTKEVLSANAPCTNGNTQFTNRIANIGSADTTMCNRWATCTNCFTTAINNLTAKDLNITLATNFIKVNTANNIVLSGVEIFDLVGKKIYSSNGKVNSNTELAVSLLSNTVYIVKVTDGTSNIAVKAIIK
jgi:hypothetical protein